MNYRLASMTLSPLQKRSKYKTKNKKNVTWNDHQLAVNTLINEASALIDIFNEVSLMIGPEIQLNNTSLIHEKNVDIPKSQWQPILFESCKHLEESLANFQPRKHLSSSYILARNMYNEI